MKLSYDLVFAGNVAYDEIHPYQGEAHTMFGSAAYIAAWSAAWSDKKLALVARMAEEDSPQLDPLRKTGMAVHVSPAEVTTYHRAIHPTEDVDQREITQFRDAGFFTMADLPDMAPTYIHLASVTNVDFNVEFVRELWSRGFTCAVDMQGFVRHVDAETGRIFLADVPNKQEIASLSRNVKLDAVEAEFLTGMADIEQAAIEVEKWGTSETMITRADGVLLRHSGRTYFESFSNRSIVGRTGRGDTTFGSYLARRLDWGVADSLRFAAALVSIKMETPGPFMGTLEQVFARMGEGRS